MFLLGLPDSFSVLDESFFTVEGVFGESCQLEDCLSELPWPGFNADSDRLCVGCSFLDGPDKPPYENRPDFSFDSSRLCAAARVCRVADCGCSSKGTAFVREDLRLPPSRKDVGPSTAIRFQGGDTGRGKCFEMTADSASFRFFVGGPSSDSSETSGFEGEFERARKIS